MQSLATIVFGIRSLVCSRNGRCRNTAKSTGAIRRAGGHLRQDFAFFLRGPMDELSREGELLFWREAPRIGLAGVAQIKFEKTGVLAESVAYDLNLASDVLRDVANSQMMCRCAADGSSAERRSHRLEEDRALQRLT